MEEGSRDSWFDEPDEPPPGQDVGQVDPGFDAAPMPLDQGAAQVGTGNWTDADVAAWSRGGAPAGHDPIVPPDFDEQRRYVPDQMIERGLLDYGFKPEEAARYAQTPVQWESGVDYLGAAYPDRIGMSDGLANGQQAFDGVLAHEFIHRADQERKTLPTPDELRMEADGSIGVADVVQGLEKRAEHPSHSFHGFTYDINDPAHLTTGLAEGVNYAMSRLPEHLRAKYFPEFTGEDAPVAQRRALVDDEDARALARDIANDRDWEARQRRVPWWADFDGPIDQSEVGPPPIFGPYDKSGAEDWYDEDGNLTEAGRAMLTVR